MIRPPTGDGFQDYSGVAQSPLADKQQSANVRYSRGDWLQRVDLRPSTMSRVWSYPRTVDTLPGDCIASNGSGAS